nr:disintegrin and metalloproteinase domain-containing protein 9-like isoform X2 [Procambarus clarkii]
MISSPVLACRTSHPLPAPPHPGLASPQHPRRRPTSAPRARTSPATENYFSLPYNTRHADVRQPPTPWTSSAGRWCQRRRQRQPAVRQLDVSYQVPSDHTPHTAHPTNLATTHQGGQCIAYRSHQPHLPRPYARHSASRHPTPTMAASPPPLNHPPSAWPPSLSLTLVLLLACSWQVTSLQRQTFDGLTSPSHLRHVWRAGRQTFLAEGGATAGDFTVLVEGEDLAEDWTTTVLSGMSAQHDVLRDGSTSTEEPLTDGRRRRSAAGGEEPVNFTVAVSRMKETATGPLQVSQDDLDSYTARGSSHLLWKDEAHPLTDPDMLPWPGHPSSRDEYGVHNKLAASGDNNTKSSLTQGRRGVLQGPLWTDKRTLFVELVVMADREMYRHYRTVPAVKDRVRKVVNAANAFMNRVGVVVVLVDIRVWRDRNEIDINERKSVNAILEEMRKYRKKLLKEEPNRPNDNMVLMTADQSVSVVQDVDNEAGLVGHILAHEMGHNLGMYHDEEGVARLGHTCDFPTPTCIMHGAVSELYDPTLPWSSCSREYIDKRLETTALDCLKNLPTDVYSAGSSCGDGVVDVGAGEQCDCGPPEFCDNPCCVASQCKLAANASCASGSCCDTQVCQPKKVGSVCREAIADCDLTEYCSGHSEYCPTDVVKADGAPCRGGKGHCYQGECGSHEGRCEHVWGPYARVAASRCFTELNTKAERQGNCGMHATYDQYLACPDSSVMCGTLHCVPYSLHTSRFHQQHHNDSVQLGHDTCHYIEATEYYPSRDWLSPDGASCGQGKMCVQQRCQEITVPEGDCRDGCSGRGVCNSAGHCHCQPGFAPPDCSRAGLGGSLESGHMQDVSDNSAAITVAWVVVVLLALLFFVLCCCWGNVRRWWERRGRARLSPLLPCCASCLDACCCPLMHKTTRWIITVGSPGNKNSFVQRIRTEDIKEGEDQNMVCSVDVDIKGSATTKSWGVADEKLVTDVVTITPRNSPDLRRKVQLPSHSPVLHRKSMDVLDRPKYQQSISVDSGCVSDSDEGVASHHSIHMSMTSLISVFKNFGTKPSKPENDNRKSRAFGSQKSMPLSRLVVDPLVGNRRSRQGTPPPESLRPGFQRSVSTDVTVASRGRLAGAPLPPPAKLKPHKSDENLISDSKVKNSPFIQFKKKADPNKDEKVNVEAAMNGGTITNGNTTLTSQPPKRPIMPFRKSLSSGKVSPPRDPPPLPILKEVPLAGSSKTDVTPTHTKGTKSNVAISKTKPSAVNGNASQRKNVMDIARKFEAA